MTLTTMSLQETLNFVNDVHSDQLDWTGLPYVTHPIWVALNLPAECGDDDRHIALLHDVVEDCVNKLSKMFHIPDGEVEAVIAAIFSNIEQLGYSDYVMSGLRLVTRDKMSNLSYLTWVQSIAASNHRGAMWVKYTDNCHNSDPQRRLLLKPEKWELSRALQPRYEASKRILRAGLGLPAEPIK